MTRPGLIAAFCLASSCAVAQVSPPAQSDPSFPDTQVNHWAYAAFERLHRDLLFWVSGWHEGKAEIRRSDAAYAVNRAYEALMQRDETRRLSVPKVNALIAKLGDSQSPKSQDLQDAFHQIADLLDQVDSRADIADVGTLADAFAEDLRAKGIDTAKLKKSLTAIGRHLSLNSEAARVLASGRRPFPDTRQNHWAYEAITRMKAEGLLVGYPNGNYLGGRLSTRHEMEVQIHLAYSKLSEVMDECDARIHNVKRGPDSPREFHPPDQAQLKQREEEKSNLRDWLSGMRSYGNEISDLKRLVSEFGPEMAALGTDVAGVGRGLNAVARRITAIQADADLTRLIR